MEVWIYNVPKIVSHLENVMVMSETSLFLNADMSPEVNMLTSHLLSVLSLSCVLFLNYNKLLSIINHTSFKFNINKRKKKKQLSKTVLVCPSTVTSSLVEINPQFPLIPLSSCVHSQAGPLWEGKQTKQLLGVQSWPWAPRQWLVINKMLWQTVWAPHW